MKKNIPLLILFFSIAISSHGQWSAIGNGFDGDVNAMCVFANELYAAGNFTHNGSGTTSLNYIARWNGASWVAVGTGLGANVTSLAVFNSELYAAGDFTTAGGNSALRIARWNGSTWSAAGAGFNNTARCLYVWNNELYAGGIFTMSGATTTSRIAKLSGGAWQPAGASPGPVNTIVAYNNELYIGGYWYPPYVCKLNTTGTTPTWDDLPGSGPDNEVTSLAVFRKQSSSNIVLWIGGKFNTPSPRLCTWTSSGGFTTSFNNFNSAPGDVNTLLSTSSYLFAGGGFTATIPPSISKLGKYDGTSNWDSAGVLPNNDVIALANFNGNLVIGGKFTSLGAVSANRIAMRDYTLGIENENEAVLANDFFPNPLSDHSLLRIQTKSSMRKPLLQVLDLCGREVSTDIKTVSFDPFSHEIEFRIERSGLPAGIYFYLLSDQKINMAFGKFIVD